MIMRRLVVAVAVGLAMVLAGCGGGGKGGAEPVKLTLFTWTLPGELRINQDLCAEFEKSHPNIKVEVQNDPDIRAMEKLMARVAAGNPPDVMSIHGAYFM